MITSDTGGWCLFEQAEELRRTIEQQAQEITAMRELGLGWKAVAEDRAQTIARLEHELANGAAYMRAQYDSVVRMKDALQQQLDALQAERMKV